MLKKFTAIPAVALIFSVCISEGFASSVRSGLDSTRAGQSRREDSLLASARKQVMLGHFLIISGLAVQTLGASGGDPVLAVVAIPLGYFARQAGLPVLGYASDKVGDAVREMDPEYEDGNQGWGAYKASLIFAGLNSLHST